MTRTAIAQVVAAVALITGLGWAVAADAADGVVADAAPGVALAALAIAATLNPRYRATGALAALATILWFAGTWDALQWLHRGAIAWLVLAYPGARLRPRWAMAVVVAVSASAAVPWSATQPAITVVLCIAVVATAAVRLAGTPRVARGSAATALAAAVVLAVAWSLPIILRATGAAADVALFVYLFGTAYVALLLLIDVTLAPSPDSALAGVVIDLSGITDRGALRDRLARVVGDPELRLGYHLADGRYVDDRGLAVPWREPLPDLVVTPVEDDGHRVAVLVHDRAIRVDPALLPAIAAAVALALRNVELHAAVRARVADVEDSRDRLLVAENEARRALTDDLENGPRRRLRHVGQLVDRVDPLESTGRLIGATVRAEDELRRFGRGLHVAALDEKDLTASLERLGLGFPFPVDVHVELTALREEFRAAVWFICAECLTNAAKHGAPGRVTISVVLVASDVVLVTVRDDGRGGASVARGTGLAGLRERAEALHGALDVDSPPGGGTTVRAWLRTEAPVPAVTGTR